MKVDSRPAVSQPAGTLTQPLTCFSCEQVVSKEIASTAAAIPRTGLSRPDNGDSPNRIELDARVTHPEPAAFDAERSANQSLRVDGLDTRPPDSQGVVAELFGRAGHGGVSRVVAFRRTGLQARRPR